MKAKYKLLSVVTLTGISFGCDDFLGTFCSKFNCSGNRETL